MGIYSRKTKKEEKKKKRLRERDGGIQGRKECKRDEYGIRGHWE